VAFQVTITRVKPWFILLAGDLVNRPGTLRRWFKRRSVIEPVIGHGQSDCRLDPNYLKGGEADRMNAILCGCGYNIRRPLREFLFLLWKYFFHERNIAQIRLLVWPKKNFDRLFQGRLLYGSPHIGNTIVEHRRLFRHGCPKEPAPVLPVISARRRIDL